MTFDPASAVTELPAPLDTEAYLDDVALAKALLENADRNNGMLSNADIVFALRNLLKTTYYPVAIKYFYSEDDLEDFKRNNDYKTAMHAYPFCHFVAASRMRGDILLGTDHETGCSNAKYVMGWKALDDAEIKSHLKYAKSRGQAEKFVRTKKRLPEGLLAFATAPLHKAPFKPDVVHGVCDGLQAAQAQIDGTPRAPRLSVAHLAGPGHVQRPDARRSDRSRGRAPCHAATEKAVPRRTRVGDVATGRPNHHLRRCELGDDGMYRQPRPARHQRHIRGGGAGYRRLSKKPVGSGALQNAGGQKKGAVSPRAGGRRPEETKRVLAPARTASAPSSNGRRPCSCGQG